MASAGYSGTPLAKKLGIKPGARCYAASAPPNLADLLAPLPEGVRFLARPGDRLDVILLFVRRASELCRRLAPLQARLAPRGGLWVAWPKKSSGVETDLDFTVVQRAGLEAGLVDNKVCAVDETWSGLRFVYRVADRPARS